MILALLDACDMGYVGRHPEGFEDQGPDAGHPVVMGTSRFYVSLLLANLKEVMDEVPGYSEMEALADVADDFDLTWKHARAAWVWAKRCPEVPSDPWEHDGTT